MTEEDKKHLKDLEERMKSSNLTDTQKAYYNRIFRVVSMPNLTEIPGNPVNMIVEKLTKSDYFKDFEIFHSPEVVKEFETFDLFYFPDDHVARRPSDSYFLQKTDNKEDNLLGTDP